MSIRPVDMKTALLTADAASKVREDQKAQEAGQGEQVAQNKHSQETKTQTIQNTQKAEGKTVRRDNEDKKGGSNTSSQNQDQKKSPYKKEEKKPIFQDGIHGLFDLKA